MSGGNPPTYWLVTETREYPTNSDIFDMMLFEDEEEAREIYEAKQNEVNSICITSDHHISDYQILFQIKSHLQIIGSWHIIMRWMDYPPCCFQQRPKPKQI